MRGPPIRTGKRDRNEREIMAALEKAGCLVEQQDWFDLIVQTPRERHLVIEVKMPNGRLTTNQRAAIEKGWKVYVVRSIPEALQAVKEVDEKP